MKNIFLAIALIFMGLASINSVVISRKKGYKKSYGLHFKLIGLGIIAILGGIYILFHL